MASHMNHNHTWLVTIEIDTASGEGEGEGWQVREDWSGYTGQDDLWGGDARQNSFLSGTRAGTVVSVAFTRRRRGCSFVENRRWERTAEPDYCIRGGLGVLNDGTVYKAEL